MHLNWFPRRWSVLAPLSLVPLSLAPLSLAIALPAHAGLSVQESDSLQSMVQYLDYLQSCTPSVYSAPFPLLENTIAHTLIQGPVSDRCSVSTVMETTDPTGSTVQTLWAQCSYTSETIALLTDEQGYAEAVQWDQGTVDLTLDLADPRVATLSRNLEQECVFPGVAP